MKGKTNMKAAVQREQAPAVQQSGRPTEYVAPEVNIFEREDGYVLEAEMPGVNKSGLEITLEGTEITIIGHRNSETIQGRPLFRESRPADYRRVFDLDPAIDTSKITARMDQGVLILTLPKSEEVKPRKVKVE
jgi:HSP20 family protein